MKIGSKLAEIETFPGGSRSHISGGAAATYLVHSGNKAHPKIVGEGGSLKYSFGLNPNIFIEKHHKVYLII